MLCHPVRGKPAAFLPEDSSMAMVLSISETHPAPALFDCDTGRLGRSGAPQAAARAVQPGAMRTGDAAEGDCDHRLRAHPDEHRGVSHLSARGDQQIFAPQGRGELLARVRGQARLPGRPRSARCFQASARASREDREGPRHPAQPGVLFFDSARGDSATRSSASTRPA